VWQPLAAGHSGQGALNRQAEETIAIQVFPELYESGEILVMCALVDMIARSRAAAPGAGGGGGGLLRELDKGRIP